MHGIVSGKTITEDAVPEKVREHIKKNPGKSNCIERQSCKRDSVGKIEREKKRVSNVGMKERVSKFTYPTLQHCLRMLYTTNGNSKH